MNAKGPQDMKSDDELCSGVSWSPIWVKGLVTEHQWAEKAPAKAAGRRAADEQAVEERQMCCEQCWSAPGLASGEAAGFGTACSGSQARDSTAGLQVIWS